MIVYMGKGGCICIIGVAMMSLSRLHSWNCSVRCGIMRL